MKTSNRTTTIAYTVGYGIIIVSTLLFIFEYSWATYSFTLGCLLAIAGRSFSLPKGDYTTRRLNMILGIGALSLLATAYLMFKGSNSWAVTLLISAFIDLYTSFRYTQKK